MFVFYNYCIFAIKKIIYDDYSSTKKKGKYL